MRARLSLSALVVVTLSATVPAAAQDRPSPAPLSPASVLPSAPSTPKTLTPPDAPIVDVQPSFRSLFPTIGHDLMRLPSMGTAVTLGAGGALALAVSPADRNLTRQASRSEDMQDAFLAGSPLGSGYAQVGGAFATLFIGNAIHSPRVQSLGYDLVRAQVVNSVLTQGLKFAVGRTRPDGRAFSFPSGHASATFATATVLQQHFGWKVGVPAYGLAGYVAASRLQANRHFASDVIFGAAVGIVAGRTVTLGHGKTRFALAPMAVPGGAGVTVARIGTP